MKTPYVLHIYQANSGQFSGKIYLGEHEIGGIAGCKNQLEVFETMQEMYEFNVDFIVDGHSGESLNDLIFPEKTLQKHSVSTYTYRVFRTKNGKYSGLLEGSCFKNGVPFSYVRGFENAEILREKMQESYPEDIIEIIIGDE